MTVRQLLRSISSSELSEWMAYYKLENEEKKRALAEAKAQSGVQAMKAKAKAPRRR